MVATHSHIQAFFLMLANVLVTEGKEEQVRKVSTVRWWLLTHTSKLFS